jgi:hypothetical protein
MQSAAASSPLPKKNTEGFRSYSTEERVYQLVTVGAILLVLGSLWIF